MWEELAAVMEQMLELYQALLAIGREKRKTLVAAQTAELEEITKKEEAIIVRLGKLEGRRGAVARDLADVYGVQAEDLTLDGLAKLADELTAARLKALGGQFGGVAAELKELNEINTKLIKQALSYINYNVNLLSRSASVPVYAPKGHAADNAAPARTLFDQKV